MKHVFIDAKTTTIASSGTPGITTVASYLPEYDAAYFMVQISDTGNNHNHHELREMIVMDDFSSAEEASNNIHSRVW